MTKLARGVVIQEYCKELRLPRVQTEYQDLAREAQDGSWDYEDYLLPLLEREVLARREGTAQRRLRAAHFPDVKTLDQVDWKAMGGVSKPKIMALASCEYIEKREEVILLGPIGTGKTHLAIALGLEATRNRFRVAFMTAAELVRQLQEARDERILGRLHQKYQKVPLLILDEMGFVPFERAGGQLLFNLLSERHGRASTIVTTNLNFGEWSQVFGDEKLTTALLDRLTENAHILVTKGLSYRSRRRRGGDR
ncbi:MAG: IS21-like element helper ATPase IstB [Dehalococcoidia bacterium]